MVCWVYEEKSNSRPKNKIRLKKLLSHDQKYMYCIKV